MSLYFKILIFSFALPFIFSFHPKINFYKYWTAFFKSNIIVAIPFIIWDIIFTYNGVWGFNEKHIGDLYIFNLPVEEVLFFIIIPYCCVFTYFLFDKLSISSGKFTNNLTKIIAICMLVFGVIENDHIYTVCTFISLGTMLGTLSFLKKDFMATFYLNYFFITFSFFLIVNGILTGGDFLNNLTDYKWNTSYPDHAPVWYNNEENLGIRVWTIPLEDFFYSMLLLLSNIWLFDYFRKK